MRPSSVIRAEFEFSRQEIGLENPTPGALRSLLLPGRGPLVDLADEVIEDLHINEGGKEKNNVKTTQQGTKYKIRTYKTSSHHGDN